MNIIYKWTLRTLKLNKSRTIVTVIGIMLSALLITSVATLCVSFQQYAVKKTIDDSGNWEAQFANIAYKEVPIITEDKQTAEVMLQRTVGSQAVTVTGPFHGNLLLTELDPESFANFSIYLVQGELPKNSDEIVLSTAYLEASGKSYKVGDKVTFALGGPVDVTDGGSTSHVKKAPQQPSQTENASSQSASGPAKEYTIVGIMSSTSVNAEANDYTAISYLDTKSLKPDDDVSVYIRSQNPRNELGDALGKKLGKSVIYNTQLLQIQGVFAGGDVNTTIYGIGAIMFIIIMIGSIALIYNSFAISVSERLRQFGMLSSVGATRKQLRNSVLFEGFFLGLVSLPIGMIGGISGTGLALKLLAPAFQRLFNEGLLNDSVDFNLVISWYVIGFAFMIGMITILFSAWIPTKKAGNISAMDAIRLTDDIKITRKKIQTSRLTRKWFGFEAELALKNLKRNRKKFRATVFSFFISIVLFIVVSSFTMYMRNSAHLAETNNIDGDILTSFVSGKFDNEDKLIGELTSIQGVTRYSVYKNMSKILSIPTEALDPSLREALYPGKQAAYMGVGVSIYGINEQDYRKYLKSEGLSYDEFNDPQNPKAIAINRTQYIGTKDTKVYSDVLKPYMPVHVQILGLLSQSHAYGLALGVSDDLGGTMTDFNVERQNDTVVHDDLSNYFDLKADSVYSLDIAHETGNAPPGLAGISSSGKNLKMELLVSENIYEEMLKTIPREGYEYDQVTLDAKDSTGVMGQAYDLFLKNGIPYSNLYNLSGLSRHSKNLVTFISIFCYSFITLITLIAVVNIFNTISTNIYLRRREFAMLKSVGMTPKSFHKMIIYESAFYGIQSLFYGLLAGVLISFAIHSLLKMSVNGATGILPWGSILACICGVFVIVFITMRYAMAKVNKANIIDVLKTETI